MKQPSTALVTDSLLSEAQQNKLHRIAMDYRHELDAGPAWHEMVGLIESLIAAEREACACVAENHPRDSGYFAAKAIRARTPGDKLIGAEP